MAKQLIEIRKPNNYRPIVFVSPNFMILGGLGGIVVSSLYPTQLEAAVQEEAEEVARMID